MFFQNTEDGCCPDWVIECQNLQCGDRLYDAILTSLFTERRDPNCNSGGWWANPQKGSRIHLVSGSTNEQLAQAEDYATEALRWIEDETNLVEELQVSADYVSNGVIQLTVTPVVTGLSECSLTFTAQDGEFNLNGS